MIYAVGGLDDATCFNTVERYDPETNLWAFVASMEIPRGGVGVATLKVWKFCNIEDIHVWAIQCTLFPMFAQAILVMYTHQVFI